MVSKLKDERGASVLEVAILLPLAILLVVGGFEIWKLMTLKRALYIGAYQAARFCANNPYVSVSEREARVRNLIMTELTGTRLYNEDMKVERIAVRLDAQGCAERDPNQRCGGYGVAVEAILRVPVHIPPFFAAYPSSLLLPGKYRHDPCKRCD